MEDFNISDNLSYSSLYNIDSYADINDDNITNLPSKKLLLIPSSINNLDDIANNLSNNTIYLEYGWEMDSFKSLEYKMQEISSKFSITNIGVLSTKSNNYKILRNQQLPIEEIAYDIGQQNFWIQALKVMNFTGGIDLIAFDSDNSSFSSIASLNLASEEGIAKYFLQSAKCEHMFCKFPDDFLKIVENARKWKRIRHSLKSLSSVFDNDNDSQEDERQKILLAISSQLENSENIKEIFNKNVDLLKYDFQMPLLKLAKIIREKLEEGKCGTLAFLNEQNCENIVEDFTVVDGEKFFFPWSEPGQKQFSDKFLVFWDNIFKGMNGNGNVDFFDLNIDDKVSIRKLMGLSFADGESNHDNPRRIKYFYNKDIDNKSTVDKYLQNDNANDVEIQQHFEKLLLVSSRVEDRDDLLSAVKENVKVIEYDWESTTLEELQQSIENVLGNNLVESIAFANHGTDGEFFLTKSAAVNEETVKNDEGIANFWKNVSSKIEEGGRIDLLACNLAGSQSGKQLVKDLETFSRINFAASSNVTGNVNVNGDWILETDNINVRDEYFHKNINNWESSLAGQMLENYDGTSYTTIFNGTIVQQTNIHDLSNYLPTTEERERQGAPTSYDIPVDELGIIFKEYYNPGDWDTPVPPEAFDDHNIWSDHTDFKYYPDSSSKNPPVNDPDNLNEDTLAFYYNYNVSSSYWDIEDITQDYKERVYYYMDKPSDYKYDTECVNAHIDYILSSTFSSFDLDVNRVGSFLNNSYFTFERTDEGESTLYKSYSDIMNISDTTARNQAIQDFISSMLYANDKKIIKFDAQTGDEGIIYLEFAEAYRMDFDRTRESGSYYSGDLRGLFCDDTLSAENVSENKITIKHKIYDPHIPEVSTNMATMTNGSYLNMDVRYFNIDDYDRIQQDSIKSLDNEDLNSDSKFYAQWEADYSFYIEPDPTRIGVFKRRDSVFSNDSTIKFKWSELSNEGQEGSITFESADYQNYAFGVIKNVINQANGWVNGGSNQLTTDLMGLMELSGEDFSEAMENFVTENVDNEFKSTFSDLSTDFYSMRAELQYAYDEIFSQFEKIANISKAELRNVTTRNQLEMLLTQKGVDDVDNEFLHLLRKESFDKGNFLSSLQDMLAADSTAITYDLQQNFADISEESFVSNLRKLVNEGESEANLKNIIQDVVNDLHIIKDFYENLKTLTDPLYQQEFDLKISNHGDSKVLGSTVYSLSEKFIIQLDEPNISSQIPPAIVPSPDGKEDVYNQLRNVENGRVWIISNDGDKPIYYENSSSDSFSSWDNAPYFSCSDNGSIAPGKNTVALDSVSIPYNGTEQLVQTQAYLEPEPEEPYINLTYEITDIKDYDDTQPESKYAWRIYKKPLNTISEDVEECWELLEPGDTFTQEDLDNSRIAIIGGQEPSVIQEEGELAIAAFHFRTILPDSDNGVCRKTFPEPFYVKRIGKSALPEAIEGMSKEINGYVLSKSSTNKVDDIALALPLSKEIVEYTDPDDTAKFISYKIENLPSQGKFIRLLKDDISRPISWENLIEDVDYEILKSYPGKELESSQDYIDKEGDFLFKFSQQDVYDEKIFYVLSSKEKNDAYDYPITDVLSFSISDDIQPDVVDIPDQSVEINVGKIDWFIDNDENSKYINFDGDSSITKIPIEGRADREVKTGGDFLEVPNFMSLFEDNDGVVDISEGSIEMLFKPGDHLSEEASEQVLFSFSEHNFDESDINSPIDKSALFLVYNSINDTMYLKEYVKGNNSPNILYCKDYDAAINSLLKVNKNEWHHVSFNWEDGVYEDLEIGRQGTNGKFSIFIDGKLAIEFEKEGIQAFDIDNGIDRWENLLTFGAINNDNHYKGLMKDIRVWNYSRNDLGTQEFFSPTVTSDPGLLLSFRGDNCTDPDVERIIENDSERIVFVDGADNESLWRGLAIDEEKLPENVKNTDVLPITTEALAGTISKGQYFYVEGLDENNMEFSQLCMLRKDSIIYGGKTVLSFSPPIRKEISAISIRPVKKSSEAYVVKDHFGVFVASIWLEQSPIDIHEVDLSIEGRKYMLCNDIGTDLVPETGDYLVYAFAYVKKALDLFQNPVIIKNGNGVYYQRGIVSPTDEQKERIENMENVCAQLFFIREQLLEYQEFLSDGIPKDKKLLSLEKALNELNSMLKVYPYGSHMESFYKNPEIEDKMTGILKILENYLYEEEKIEKVRNPSLQTLLMTNFWRSGEAMLNEAILKLDERLSRIQEGMSLLSELEEILNADISILEYDSNSTNVFIEKVIERNSENAVTKSFYKIVEENNGRVVYLDPGNPRFVTLGNEKYNTDEENEYDKAGYITSMTSSDIEEYLEKFSVFKALFDEYDSYGNVTSKGLVSKIGDLYSSLDPNNSIEKSLMKPLGEIWNTLLNIDYQHYQSSRPHKEGYNYAQWKDNGFSLDSLTRVLNRIYGSVDDYIYRENGFLDFDQAADDGKSTNATMNATFINKSLRTFVNNAVSSFNSEIASVREEVKKANVIFEEFLRSAVAIGEEFFENVLEIIRKSR